MLTFILASHGRFLNVQRYNWSRLTPCCSSTAMHTARLSMFKRVANLIFRDNLFWHMKSSPSRDCHVDWASEWNCCPTSPLHGASRKLPCRCPIPRLPVVFSTRKPFVLFLQGPSIMQLPSAWAPCGPNRGESRQLDLCRNDRHSTPGDVSRYRRCIELHSTSSGLGSVKQFLRSDQIGFA